MVSPSKLQQHRQQQKVKRSQSSKSKSNEAAKAAQTASEVVRPGISTASSNKVRILKGPKPLENKTFYLDIKNHALSAKFEAKIKELGGGIELFLVKNITLVVSDRSDKTGQVTISDKRKWGYTSGGSGGLPSLKSIEVPTPTPTPPTPYRSVEGPLSNSTNQRGQTVQRSKSRVDAMLERALTQPQQCSVDPLNNAINWGIPIWSTYELHAWLEKIIASLKDSSQNIKRDNRISLGKELKVKHLKEPYIKFESYRRESRPVFVELQTWPTLNFDGDSGSCPFDISDKKGITSVNKEIKENREKHCNINKSKGKDMTRRPRATATRARKTENTGYCEICRIDYQNLSKHLQSDQHLNFVGNDKNFLSLDNLITTGVSVEAFLKINRSRDVSKDCNLFSSRDRSLDNGILPPNEKSEKRDKLNLNDYNIEEIKMIQYNGARRNLNSKLDAPHNLRTRAKHESGHLLRSKGRASDEVEKSEKSYEKYIIKKRAKGTIWIEENDSEDEKDLENEQVDCDGKELFDQISEPEMNKNSDNGPHISNHLSMNGDINITKCTQLENRLNLVTTADNLELKDSCSEAKTNINGCEKKEEQHKVDEVSACVENNESIEANSDSVAYDDNVSNTINNVHSNEKLVTVDKDDTNSLKSISKDEKGKFKSGRRGGRSYRGRHRLSVEERLIEDNRDYYKVEVLGNKLRSSVIPSNSIYVSPLKEEVNKSKKEDKPSSEKPVVVRFKRVRKSELSLLSDEAESFMFGDTRRDDDYSDNSDDEESSVLPKDTESDRDDTLNSIPISSSPHNVILKHEINEDDSHDSTSTGRARKRRRTQTEALIMDNTDYYKFETPGSRLRYQAPLTGICDPIPDKDLTQPAETVETPVTEKLYPSKPSPEVEKMHFSFEAVPKSEPWYQTYQRQDEGAEFWHYFSESDVPRPFLLPYEIENFHEILQKSLQSGVHRKRGRGRGGHINIGNRSPRKSPRCHASTLAIMSTIIRRREQQTAALSTIAEESKPKTVTEMTRSVKKSSEKSDIDEDLKEIVKNIDNMLSSNDTPEVDYFEADLLKNIEDTSLESEVTPKGAPPNLLELLDTCHDIVPQNGIDNSSCASSECGEMTTEFPLKRRKKKRKNKTGWPGNKMRRKLHIKHLSEELQKELDRVKMAEESVNDTKLAVMDLKDDSTCVSLEDESNEVEHETGKENEHLQNMLEYSRICKGRKTKSKDYKDIVQNVDENKETQEIQDKTSLQTLNDVSSHQMKNSECLEKLKLEKEDESEDDIHGLDIKHADNKTSLLGTSEDTDKSLLNNENIFVKDSNPLSPLEKRSPKKFGRKRQRNKAISSEASNQLEIENQRQSSVCSSMKKHPKDTFDRKNISLDDTEIAKKSRRKSKKSDQYNKSPSKIIFDDENCKKQSILSSKERRKMKRINQINTVSSELQNGDVDSTFSDRVSPNLAPSPDVDERRSSIDFQPVVRVMKIEDQVDIDNSILSVTVASNRRLRSSSSPRSNMQPPTKRFRHGSGRRQFSEQWIKNS